MLSRRCQIRNEVIIPQLLREHGPSSNPAEIIDLRNADNDFMRENLAASLSTITDDKSAAWLDLAYTNDIGGSKAVRSALANLFKQQMKASQDLSPEEIVLAAGTSFILDALVEAICDPGDMIMIATPYWSGLDIPISIHNAAKVLPVSVPLDIFFAPESIRLYEYALRCADSPVKAVLICNPHNPLGGCYTERTLYALANFCQANNLHLISDEVYALSTHGMNSDDFISSHAMRDLEFVHTVYGLGKDFGCNGIRMGALRTRNEAIRLSVALSTHSQVSSLTTRFCMKHIFNEKTIRFLLNENRISLRNNFLAVASFLQERNLLFYPPVAGFFVFAKLCGGDEKEFGRDLGIAGVAVTSGTSYHFSERGWFRICFGISSALLQEVLRRIDLTLDTRQAGHGVCRLIADAPQTPEHIAVEAVGTDSGVRN
ncbi:aminotransferase GliI [Clohesyomyces aquaticus]|uniref:Aminotransferase GliI n=1 Tax=Clohesyomyces aquaticus TaxID=1231657 RepID=A0A1Y1ZUJ4_9PLEO|nr:aminotransferase GliI [Clohesyomyces aquaticus]